MNNEKVQTKAEIVIWDNKYSIGVELIDAQHKQLVVLTNELFQACMLGESAVQTVFKDAMSRMVDYVRIHFSEEQELLQRVKFPDYSDHKSQHDRLIQQILSAVKEHKEGKKFVPNQFVRTLRDWILSHIAVYDKAFGVYVQEQIKKGVLTEKDLK